MRGRASRPSAFRCKRRKGCYLSPICSKRFSGRLEPAASAQSEASPFGIVVGFLILGSGIQAAQGLSEVRSDWRMAEAYRRKSLTTPPTNHQSLVYSLRLEHQTTLPAPQTFALPLPKALPNTKCRNGSKTQPPTLREAPEIWQIGLAPRLGSLRSVVRNVH